MNSRQFTFAAAIAVAFLAVTPASTANWDPRIPTFGEVLGEQAATALNGMRNYARQTAEFTAAIRQARTDYWRLYPNGNGLKEAEARFGQLLLEKDLYYLVEKIALNASNDGSAGYASWRQSWDRILSTLSGGGIDGGIDLMASGAFDSWVGAVQGQMKKGRSMVQAIEDTLPDYKRYIQARNASEYFISQHSPLRSSDPKEYLIGVLMRNSHDTAWRPVYGDYKPAPPLSPADAEKKLKELANIIGEKALLEAAQKVMLSRRRDDPYFVDRHPPERPEAVIDGAIQFPGEQQAIYIFLSPRPSPRPDEWINNWKQARQTYDKYLKEKGAARIKAAWDMIKDSPKGFGGDQGARIAYLLDPGALGCDAANVSICFESLLALNPEEFAKREKAFKEARDALTPVAGHFDIVWTDPDAGTGPGTLTNIVGAYDDALYLNVRKKGIVKVSLDGSKWELLLDTSKKAAANGGGYHPLGHLIESQFSSIIVGKDGMLYGSLFATPANNHGRICRIDPKGGDITVIGDLSIVEEIRKWAKMASNVYLYTMDNDGNLIGQVRNERLASYLFLMKSDGSEARLLYKFSFFPTRLKVVDGGDGYLYVLAMRQEAGSVMVSGDEHTMGGLFRVSKSGSGFQALDEFEFKGVIARDFLLGSDGKIYMTASEGTGGDDGVVYHMNRDGSGGTPVYRYRSRPPFAGAPPRVIVENTDGLLYAVDHHPKGSGQLPFRVGKNGEGVKYFEGNFPGAGGDMIAHNGAIYWRYMSSLYRLIPPLPDKNARPARPEVAKARVPTNMYGSARGRILPPPQDLSSPTSPATKTQPGGIVRTTPPPAQTPRVGRVDPRAPLKAEQVIQYDGNEIEFTGTAGDIAELEAAANAGNARACLLLGELIVHGKIDGTMADAASWFEKGALRLDPECSARLARLLMDGHAEGVNPRYQRPQMWRQLASTAAARGSPLGMYLMAECSAKGIGIRPSEPIARQWYQKAAAAGHPLAQQWCEENAVSYTSTGARPAGRVR